MKNDCIAIIENQIIMKIIFDDKSYKTFDMNLKRLLRNGFGKS